MTIRFLGIGKFQIVYVHVCVQCRVSPLINVYKTKTLYMLSDFDTAQMSQPPSTRGGEEQPPAIAEESSSVTGEPISPSPVIIPTPPPGFTEPGPPGLVPETGLHAGGTTPLQAIHSQESPQQPPPKRPRTESTETTVPVPGQTGQSAAGAGGALVPAAPAPRTSDLAGTSVTSIIPVPPLGRGGFGPIPSPARPLGGVLRPAFLAFPEGNSLSVYPTSILLPPTPSAPLSFPLGSPPASLTTVDTLGGTAVQQTSPELPQPLDLRRRRPFQPITQIAPRTTPPPVPGVLDLTSSRGGAPARRSVIIRRDPEQRPPPGALPRPLGAPRAPSRETSAPERRSGRPSPTSTEVRRARASARVRPPRQTREPIQRRSTLCPAPVIADLGAKLRQLRDSGQAPWITARAKEFRPSPPERIPLTFSRDVQFAGPCRVWISRADQRVVPLASPEVVEISDDEDIGVGESDVRAPTGPGRSDMGRPQGGQGATERPGEEATPAPSESGPAPPHTDPPVVTFLEDPPCNSKGERLIQGVPVSLYPLDPPLGPGEDIVTEEEFEQMGEYHRALEFFHEQGYVRHKYMTMSEEELEIQEGKKERQRRRVAGEDIPLTPPQRGEERRPPSGRPDETAEERRTRREVEKAWAPRGRARAALAAGGVATGGVSTTPSVGTLPAAPARSASTPPAGLNSKKGKKSKGPSDAERGRRKEKNARGRSRRRKKPRESGSDEENEPESRSDRSRSRHRPLTREELILESKPGSELARLLEEKKKAKAEKRRALALAKVPESEGGKAPRAPDPSSGSVVSRSSVRSGQSEKSATSGTSKTSVKSRVSQVGSQIRVTTLEAFRSMKNVVFPKKRARPLPVPEVTDLETGICLPGLAPRRGTSRGEALTEEESGDDAIYDPTMPGTPDEQERAYRARKEQIAKDRTLAKRQAYRERVEAERYAEDLERNPRKGLFITEEHFAALERGEVPTPPTPSPGTPERPTMFQFEGEGANDPPVAEGVFPAGGERLPEPTNYEERQEHAKWVEAIEVGVMFGLETALMSFQPISPPGEPDMPVPPETREALRIACQERMMPGANLPRYGVIGERLGATSGLADAPGDPYQGFPECNWTASTTRPVTPETEAAPGESAETESERMGRELAERIERDQQNLIRSTAAYVDSRGVVHYGSDPDILVLSDSPPQTETRKSKRKRSASAVQPTRRTEGPGIPTIAHLEKVHKETFEVKRTPVRWALSHTPRLPVLRQYPAVEGQPAEDAREYRRARPDASFRPPTDNPGATDWVAASPPESRPTVVDYDQISPDLFEAPLALPTDKINPEAPFTNLDLTVSADAATDPEPELARAGAADTPQAPPSPGGPAGPASPVLGAADQTPLRDEIQDLLEYDFDAGLGMLAPGAADPAASGAGISGSEEDINPASPMDISEESQEDATTDFASTTRPDPETPPGLELGAGLVAQGPGLAAASSVPGLASGTTGISPDPSSPPDGDEEAMEGYAEYKLPPARIQYANPVHPCGYDRHTPADHIPLVETRLRPARYRANVTTLLATSLEPHSLCPRFQICVPGSGSVEAARSPGGEIAEYCLSHEGTFRQVQEHLEENDRRPANYVDVGGPQGEDALAYHRTLLRETVSEALQVTRLRRQLIPPEGTPISGPEFTLVPKARAAYQAREEAIRGEVAHLKLGEDAEGVRVDKYGVPIRTPALDEDIILPEIAQLHEELTAELADLGQSIPRMPALAANSLLTCIRTLREQSHLYWHISGHTPGAPVQALTEAYAPNQSFARAIDATRGSAIVLYDHLLPPGRTGLTPDSRDRLIRRKVADREIWEALMTREIEETYDLAHPEEKNSAERAEFQPSIEKVRQQLRNRNFWDQQILENFEEYGNVQPLHVEPAGQPPLDALLTGTRVTVPGERVSWYRTPRVGGVAAQGAFLPWRRFRRQAREVLRHHATPDDPPWFTIDRWTYYEIIRADILILSDQTLGQEPYGLLMPGVCLIAVRGAEFHHLIALYELIRSTSAKLQTVVFFTGLRSFMRVVANPLKGYQSSSERDAVKGPIIDYYCQELGRMVRQVRAPERPGGGIFVALPGDLEATVDPFLAGLWEETRSALFDRPDHEMAELCGDAAHVWGLALKRDRVFLPPRSQTYRPADIGVVLVRLEQSILTVADLDLQLVFSHACVGVARFWQDVILSHRMEETGKLSPAEVVSHREALLSLWLDDTTFPLEYEFREASLGHTPLGADRGGYRQVQQAYNEFCRVATQRRERGDRAETAHPLQYDLPSTRGFLLGPIESRLHAVVTLIIKAATDTQELEAWLFRTPLNELARRFGVAFGWEGIFGDEESPEYAAWDATIASAPLGDASEDEVDPRAAQTIVNALDSLCAIDLMALVLVRGPRALSNGLRALWQDPLTKKTIRWTVEEISAYQALGGSDKLALLLGDEERFNRVRSERYVQALNWIAAQPTLPLPTTVGQVFGIATPHLRDILGDPMCLALWGPGACDFPSGLKMVWKHATFHVLAYAPLLFEGIPVTPLQGVEALPPQTGLEDVRWSGGRPSRPRYDDAVSGMRVSVPGNDATGTPARIVPEMREAYIPSTLVLPQACLSYRRAMKAQKPPSAPAVCRPPSPRGPPDGPPGSAGGGTGGRRRFGTTRGGGRSASRGGVSRGQSTGSKAVAGPVGRGLTPEEAATIQPPPLRAIPPGAAPTSIRPVVPPAPRSTAREFFPKSTALVRQKLIHGVAQGPQSAKTSPDRSGLPPPSSQLKPQPLLIQPIQAYNDAQLRRLEDRSLSPPRTRLLAYNPGAWEMDPPCPVHEHYDGQFPPSLLPLHGLPPPRNGSVPRAPATATQTYAAAAGRSKSKKRSAPGRSSSTNKPGQVDIRHQITDSPPGTVYKQLQKTVRADGTSSYQLGHEVAESSAGEEPPQSVFAYYKSPTKPPDGGAASRSHPDSQGLDEGVGAAASSEESSILVEGQTDPDSLEIGVSAGDEETVLSEADRFAAEQVAGGLAAQAAVLGRTRTTSSGPQTFFDRALRPRESPDLKSLTREKTADGYPHSRGEFGRPLDATVEGDDDFLKLYSRACDHAKTTGAPDPQMRREGCPLLLKSTNLNRAPGYAQQKEDPSPYRLAPHRDYCPRCSHPVRWDEASRPSGFSREAVIRSRCTCDLGSLAQHMSELGLPIVADILRTRSGDAPRDASRVLGRFADTGTWFHFIANRSCVVSVVTWPVEVARALNEYVNEQSRETSGQVPKLPGSGSNAAPIVHNALLSVAILSTGGGLLLFEEGHIPAMCWPRPLAYAAYNEDPALFKVPYYQIATRTPVQNDTGSLPHSVAETLTAVREIACLKPEHVSEGGAFDCRSVFPELGPPRASNFLADDCAVDSCDILSRMTTRDPFKDKGAKTLFAFGAAEVCRALASLDSSGAVVIDIWDILAVRILYFCSDKVPQMLDRDMAIDAFMAGEKHVPSLHQLCERLGVESRDKNLREAQRRALQVSTILAMAVAYMAQHRRSYDALCPIRMDILMAHEWMARLARPRAVAVAQREGRRRVFETYSGRLSKRAATAHALFDTHAFVGKVSQRSSFWHRTVCENVRRGWAYFQQAWAEGEHQGVACTSATSQISPATLAGQFDLLRRAWKMGARSERGSPALNQIDGNPFRGKNPRQPTSWEEINRSVQIPLALPWAQGGAAPFGVPRKLRGRGFLLREPGLEAAQQITVRHRKVPNREDPKRAVDAPREAPEPTH